jgi:hypothetical protein
MREAEAMRRFWRRLRLAAWFLGRYATGPARGESWTWLDHWRARIGPGTAWAVACVIED